MRNNCENLRRRAVQISKRLRRCALVPESSSPTTGCRWIRAVCPARYGCYSNVSAFRTVEFAGSRYVRCFPIHTGRASPWRVHWLHNGKSLAPIASSMCTLPAVGVHVRGLSMKLATYGKHNKMRIILLYDSSILKRTASKVSSKINANKTTFEKSRSFNMKA